MIKLSGMNTILITERVDRSVSTNTVHKKPIDYDINEVNALRYNWVDGATVAHVSVVSLEQRSLQYRKSMIHPCRHTDWPTTGREWIHTHTDYYREANAQDDREYHLVECTNVKMYVYTTQ